MKKKKRSPFPSRSKPCLVGKCILSLWFFFLVHLSLSAQMKGPTRPLTSNTISQHSHSSWSYRFYKKNISPLSGKSCPMEPSCSNYAQTAFAKKGFLRGMISMSDRLTRCGSDLRFYPLHSTSKKDFFRDPFPSSHAPH